jgi:uncharacterized protein (DUF305 family)
MLLHRLFLGLGALQLLAACREPSQEVPHTADLHQTQPSPVPAEKGVVSPRGVPVASALEVVRQTHQRLRSLTASGNVDHDMASLLQEHYRGTLQLVALELRTGRDPVLRALADTLRRERQREEVALGTLAGRTHGNASEEANLYYQEFTRDQQAALDSAARYPPAVTGNPDADFAAGLTAHLQLGLLLAEDGIAHGSDPSLIAFAHRFVHDQRLHLHQVQAWSSTHTTPAH